MAVVFDGRIILVKAQYHPVCVTLATTAALLSGTVDYCGASGELPELAELDTQFRFQTQLFAQLMTQQSIVLLQQDLRGPISGWRRLPGEVAAKRIAQMAEN
jgi:hypothetical protein